MNGGTAETSTIWATRPVPCRPTVSTHLTTAGRETDQRGVVKVEVLE
ncbi:hypothetical protein [Rhodococcus opacus]|nr:hypothetical protein [Rhodococcus opacus]